MYFLILILLLVSSSQTRPVSYPGGWTVLSHNDAFSQALHVHYSPTAFHSLGIRQEKMEKDNSHRTYIQNNFLLKRINAPHSQANWYLKTGLGYANPKGNGKDLKEASFAELSWDWEDRRWFVMLAGKLDYRRGMPTTAMSSYRVGWAPYVADYGKLHTWIMLQADHRPDDSDSVTLTPLLRFFKGTQLFEIGYSDKDTLLINFIWRF